MRDVTLWAFTVPFFSEQTGMLAEFEADMAGIDQPLDAYLAQLSSIRTHDATDRLAAIDVPTLVLAGEQDILIPVSLSRELHAAIRGAEWATTRAATLACGSRPSRSTPPSPRFSREFGSRPAITKTHHRRRRKWVQATWTAIVGIDWPGPFWRGISIGVISCVAPLRSGGRWRHRGSWVAGRFGYGKCEDHGGQAKPDAQRCADRRAGSAGSDEVADLHGEPRSTTTSSPSSSTSMSTARCTANSRRSGGRPIPRPGCSICARA